MKTVLLSKKSALQPLSNYRQACLTPLRLNREKERKSLKGPLEYRGLCGLDTGADRGREGEIDLDGGLLGHIFMLKGKKTYLHTFVTCTLLVDAFP